MSKLIQEAVSLALTADSRVDDEAGVIRGVKVLGSASRNNRVYPAALLARRYGAYEAAQVYADHDYEQVKSGRARPLGQWGGVLRDVCCRGDAIFGDLHCLRETPAGRIILEAARRCPDRFGLSPFHLIEAEKGADGKETVTAILEVWSVDAVTRPATTSTLFEAEEKPMPDEPAANGAPSPNGAAAPAMSIEEAFAALAGAIMADPALDDQTRVGYLKKLMALKKQVLGGENEPPEEAAAEAPAEAPPAGESATLGLAGRVAALEAAGRRQAVLALIGEAFPVTDQVMADLLAMPDDVRGRTVALLKERRAPARATPGAPRSGPQRAAAAEAVEGKPPLFTAGASREEVRRYWSAG